MKIKNSIYFIFFIAISVFTASAYFDIKDKVYDVTEKYPELIEVLAGAGFENLKNDMMRKSMGKLLSLETALK